MLSENKIKILVVDDEEMIRTIIKKFLLQFTDDIICATNGKEALELYKKEKPMFVISDIVMPVMDGITFLEKVRQYDHAAKVILLTGFGTEKIIIKALRAGAINFLKKPIRIEEFITIVQKVIAINHDEKQKKINTASVFEESKKLIIHNRIDDISGAINQLLLCATNVCQEMAITGLRTGLYEIIMNAIEHGNLNITFEEKSKALEQNSYISLLEQRINDSSYKNRKVTIDYKMYNNKLEYKIKDEGNGFDWEKITFEDDFESLSRPHGRGIIMTRFYFDEVNFNKSGSEVVLVKYGDK